MIQYERLKNFLFQFANLCRLCAQEMSYGMISIDGKVEIDETGEAHSLRYLVSYCLDIDLSDDTIGRGLCQECIDRLKFIFNFKQFCKKNNEVYFVCYPQTTSIPTQELSTDEPPTVQYSVKPEPLEVTSVIQEDLEDLLVETQTKFKTEDSNKVRSRRYEEIKKNAQRQKEKRANETPEERAIRTKKASEQTRKRRIFLKVNCPEEYAKRLARVAEQRRIKRHSMAPEDRAVERAREAEAVRIRRHQMTPEQKEIVKQRNREAARTRRGSSRSLSFSDCSNNAPIDNVFIES